MIDLGAAIGVAIWIVLVALVALDEARREHRPDDGVDALTERKVRELAGRDA